MTVLNSLIVEPKMFIVPYRFNYPLHDFLGTLSGPDPFPSLPYSLKRPGFPSPQRDVDVYPVCSTGP